MNACVTAIWPITLTSNWRLYSSSDRPSTGPWTLIPALLTRPSSRPPVASRTCAAAAAIVSPSATSMIGASSRSDASAVSDSASSGRRTPA